MLQYKGKNPQRKNLVNRIAALTGKKAVYTKVPRCAYEIGDYIVEKDGTLVVLEDEADEELLKTLADEDLIYLDFAQTLRPADECSSEEPAALGTETWDPAGATESEEKKGVVPSAWDPNHDYFDDLIADHRKPEDQTDEAANESADEQAEENAETDAAVENVNYENASTGFPIDLHISLPLSKHTAGSIRNLLCILYSRGKLLSKATGGSFHVDKELVDSLANSEDLKTAGDARNAVAHFLKDHPGALQGLSFDDTKLTFDGFAEVPDADHAQTFQHLAVAMNEMALTQKRVQAREESSENEKYVVRIGLIRLGMNGDEYKTDRKILLKNLSGNAAFRNVARK